MKIIQQFATENPCYKTNKKIKVKGLMIHSVGCSQPDASVFAKRTNRPDKNSCVHGYIDGNTGVIYQTLPWDHRGWHCGGSANSTHIGVEMCEAKTLEYLGGSRFNDKNPERTKEVVIKTYNTAVELFAYLCEKYDLNPLEDGVIISHANGHKRGWASNHGDPEHLWKKFNITLEGFKRDIHKRMGGSGINTQPEAKTPYKVKITASALNIRAGAGTEFPIVGVIRDKGVYTIVEENGYWGKLKSGAGWISLKYTKEM